MDDELTRAAKLAIAVDASTVRPRARNYADPTEANYREAVNVANTADWWRSLAVNMARHYLSPPDAGPGFDVQTEARRIATRIRTWEQDQDCQTLTELLAAELRAALGTGAGDDGEAVSVQWADEAGVPKSVWSWDTTTVPHRLYVAFNCGQFGGVRCYTRGQVRRVLSVMTAPAPNEGGVR